LRAVFEDERRDILVNHVDRSSLKADIRQMRLRMRKELSKGGDRSFDLKQDPGGLADIEFLIDFWILASAGDHPELVTFPDNVRQLEALERGGLVPREHCRGLKDAYLKLRQRIHELALGEVDGLVDDEEFADLRDWVKRRWQEVFGADVEA
jgi:glutamate-ammonia-ligase adenylyltransferase